MAVNDRTDCTPASVLHTYDCLKCGSESELKMLLMLFWANASGYTMPDDIEALIALGECWTCTSAKQKLEAEVTAMANVYATGSTTAEFMAQVKCLPCMSPELIAAITAVLKCHYWGDNQD